MMKVLQINVCLHIGGTGMIMEGIGQQVLNAGGESVIAYSRNLIATGPRSASRLIRIGSPLDFYRHVALSRLFDGQGLYSRRTTLDFLKEVDAFQPDIIHLHNIHGYYLHYPTLSDYIQRHHIPVIWTLHDCWPFTGRCAYFDAVGCNQWQQGCGACPQKSHYPATLFWDRSQRNYRLKKACFTALDHVTFVPVSDWLGDLLSHSFLKDQPKRVIHNGIDIDRFRPMPDSQADLRAKYGVGDKKVVLGVASTWEPRKGLDDFLKLATKLPDEVRIILLGLTEQQMKSLPANILGLRRTSNYEELLGLYTLSHVFCNPTYEDNFPTTNLEALACGTPVITYRTGGSVEAIDAETGLVVEKGDIAGLYEAVMTVLEQPKERFAAKCRARAVAKWNKEDRFKEYLDLYNEIHEESHHT